MSSLEQFVKTLVRSRLVASEEAVALLKEARARDKQLTSHRFAAELVRSGRLTKYQAKCVYHGEVDHLVLGNYVVLEQVGAGGMGLVFKGLHRRMKRLVALKVLPPNQMKTADAVARFQREVEAAARLSHPHIVTAHDADEDRGIHYLVMEYVDGRDLAPRHEQDVFPPMVAANYILQAAEGLEYAHNQGLVHRDIKPANLLVDSHGVVKILDMGLARFDEAAVDETQAWQPGLTRAGEIMGTVDFMSPEQAEDFRHADARSDIYSLGCAFHCLLFARGPYRADTLLRKLLAHRDQPIPSLRERDAEIPEELDRIFQKMVAKQPEDRYQTASEVMLALEAAGARTIETHDDEDPYLDWLGVPPESLPPNDYELLGVRVFENDLGRIRIGYQRQMAKVRPHLDGGRSGDAYRVLEELAKAYRRLSHPQEKEAYDHELLGATGEPEPAAEAARPDTVTKPPSTWAQTPGGSSGRVVPAEDDEDYQLKDIPEEKGAAPGAKPATTPSPSGASAARLRVECPCGKKLAVRADLSGKTVQCPGCHRRLTVPASASGVAPPSGSPSSAATSSGSPLEVACRCGQRYHARPDLAGKTVKCLRCGAPLAVPNLS